ncbi:FAD-binding domain-containing protein [Natronocalculus amylovorans]|uniref:Deoxyribodipyrimidine photo-lyase n=1 Tax=Natronocalculus amylovorans TaxID=2917812 RepID=A0AAE3K8V4_9EURY|nr:FAD-binding domain-containing protein [Natronocalculus amylovorans]MCL9817421.1 deoxyribodipyrimidine photo-lyase [Natronocalculus amylovorans]
MESSVSLGDILGSVRVVEKKCTDRHDQIITPATVSSAITIAVWHRRDLRTVDNEALTQAASDGVICPLFVFDPSFYDGRGRACDARIEFLFESLEALKTQYRTLGSDLELLFGDPITRLRELLENNIVDAIYFNAAVTHGRARERDETIAGWPETTVFYDDGIARNVADTRDDWVTQCTTYFTAEQYPQPQPQTLSPPDTPPESDCTIDEIRSRFDVHSQKTQVPRGGRTAGTARLERFCETIGMYPQSISPPAAAEQHCSRLSPYLKFGVLSLREVYQTVQSETIDGRGRAMFESRLYWNRHYTQKLQEWPEWTTKSLNPVFRNLHRNEFDERLDRAWRTGQTGFPIVDAAMRALVETGWISFRMRSLVATFYSYILKQWWKRGADFLYYHLIDADPAINYTQWQSQAGLVGVHPIRVYNPRKQTIENDPDGTFIRKYVPELAPLPTTHLAQPDKTPLAVQAECGVEIGETYPYPVVEFEAEAAAARSLFESLHPRATEALRSDPELMRRASLSRRARHDTTDPTTTDTSKSQAQLDDF